MVKSAEPLGLKRLTEAEFHSASLQANMPTVILAVERAKIGSMAGFTQAELGAFS
jgi:hypothetical protein